MRVEQDIVDRLIRRSLTLAVAESCTGGLVGYRLTSVSGSSACFLGGVIAYANEVKIRHLGVSRERIKKQGAVSAIVAREMAAGVRKRFGAGWGIGITGIAGPGGGSPGKPVGLVYIALAHSRGSCAKRFLFRGSRRLIRESACRAALKMLAARLGK